MNLFTDMYLCGCSFKALSDGRLLPKVDRDRLLHDVQLHIRMSGFREQGVKSTRSALQQVLTTSLYSLTLLKGHAENRLEIAWIN